MFKCSNIVDSQPFQRVANEDITAEAKDQTFTMNTHNRFAVLDPESPESQSHELNEQVSSATAVMTSEHPNSSNDQHGSLYNLETRKESTDQPESQNGPMLMIGDSILRGIQQRKLCNNTNNNNNRHSIH